MGGLLEETLRDDGYSEEEIAELLGERSVSESNGHRPKWDRELVASALRRWEREKKQRPTFDGWRVCRDRSYPTISEVLKWFGTWNAAMEFAGFPPVRKGRPPADLSEPKEDFVVPPLPADVRLALTNSEAQAHKDRQRPLERLSRLPTPPRTTGPALLPSTLLVGRDALIERSAQVMAARRGLVWTRMTDKARQGMLSLAEFMYEAMVEAERSFVDRQKSKGARMP